MGPRLGRVEYGVVAARFHPQENASMGPRLGRVEYGWLDGISDDLERASMGPRLGRVEYLMSSSITAARNHGFNGATLRTRGIRIA